MTQNDDTRDRFLAAIAERLTPDTIAEAHVFPPIRQGGVESGVAVIAVSHGSLTSGEGPSESLLTSGGEVDVNSPLTSGEAAAEHSRRASFDSARAPAENGFPRFTVYTAKYRLTVKGPERGKWEFALQADADAPRLTIDKVVRGVQQRSGDAEEPVRLSGEEFRALLPLTP
jgi:hypothetical protein